MGGKTGRHFTDQQAIDAYENDIEARTGPGPPRLIES